MLHIVIYFYGKRFKLSKYLKQKKFSNVSILENVPITIPTSQYVSHLFCSLVSDLTVSSKSKISQIKLFNSAKKIIGVHGAAFTNIIFCKKSTSVIELKDINSKNSTIGNIAKKIKLNFATFYLKKTSNDDKKSWNGLLYLNEKILSKILA